MPTGDYGTDLAVRAYGLGGHLVLQAAGGDLVPVTGQENLAQALWLRLVTPEGELTHLGHPDYGSRLYRLIGRLNTPETQALARAYVRQAISRERRVRAIEALAIYTEPAQPDALRIEVRVRPESSPEPLNLALSFTLERQTEA